MFGTNFVVQRWITHIKPLDLDIQHMASKPNVLIVYTIFRNKYEGEIGISLEDEDVDLQLL